MEDRKQGIANIYGIIVHFGDNESKAIGLYNAGYRKADDLIVENERLKTEIKEVQESYDKVYEQAEADIRANIADGGTSCHWCINSHNKATAKEILEKFLFGITNEEVFEGTAKSLYVDLLKKIVREYGVE